MKKVKVYLAGPFSSNPPKNTRIAIELGSKLIKMGFIPFIPHLTLLVEFVDPDLTYEDYLEWDFAWLDTCDVLLRFPGESPGADREIEHADAMGVPVVYSIQELVAITDGVDESQ